MKLRLALILVFAAAMTRLLPHPLNFTPLGAMGLFAAAYFNRDWKMMVIPATAWFLSDLILNNIVYASFMPGFTLFTPGALWIYGALALIMGVGYLTLRSQVTPAKVIVASLMASAVFFLVSNISSWLSLAIYPKTIGGLMACYAAGLPFLGNTIMGDLFFSMVLFGTYEWASKKTSLTRA